MSELLTMEHGPLTPQALADAGVEVVLHFPSPGNHVYIRETRFSQVGTQLAMHEHTRGHYSALTRGAVILQKGEFSEVIEAGGVVDVPAGVPHVVTALEVPATWLCIHAVPSDLVNERDPEMLDALVTDAEG